MTYTVTPTVSISSLDANLTIGAASSTYTMASPWHTTGVDYTISSSPLTVQPKGKLSLQGEDADIEINGESLVAMLKRIEERINLLTVNHKLESEWEELRELGNQYRELEQRIKDKLETWNKLQAQDKDNR